MSIKNRDSISKDMKCVVIGKETYFIKSGKVVSLQISLNSEEDRQRRLKLIGKA